jgi:hypothetical protein
MISKKKLFYILEKVYWEAHTDGRICGKNSRKANKQVSDPEWIYRRELIIRKAIDKICERS